MAHLQKTKKTHVSTALADEAMASQKSIVFVLIICLALLASRPVTGEISRLPPADLTPDINIAVRLRSIKFSLWRT